MLIGEFLLAKSPNLAETVTYQHVICQKVICLNFENSHSTVRLDTIKIGSVIVNFAEWSVWVAVPLFGTISKSIAVAK